ncbi:MAG: hypothetical protein GY845_04445, partial [Planctomycetes bacterium]|nr:hypothetical protein [Planctomycetota bacterium]
GLRRTAALDKSANPFSFLLDEFVDFEEQISQLNDSTEEQIKLQEKQVSTLSDMYNLAQTEAANLKASNNAVQSMIDQLTLQSVGTSFEDIETRYNELFNQALTSLDTADIQSFLTFTNDYMETLESAGMDAETVRISTKADLEYLQGAIDSQLTVVEENTNAILELTNAVEVLAQGTQAADAWQAAYDAAFSGTFQTVDQSIYNEIAELTDDISGNVAFWVRERKQARIDELNAVIQRTEAYNAAIQAERDAFLANNPQPTQTAAASGGGGQMVTINLSMDGSQVAESVVLQISNSGELTQVLQNSVN